MTLRVDTKRAIDTDIEFVKFARLFLRHRRKSLHENTYVAHRFAIEVPLTEAFAGQPVRVIDRPQVCVWYRQYGCPRTLSVLSQIMNHAIKLGVRSQGTNPCKGLRRKQSTFEAHYPSESDYGVVAEVLKSEYHRYPQYARAAWCMLLTGMRRGEVCSLRWKHIQGDRIMLLDAKHGPRTVWVTQPLRRLLEEYPRVKGVKYVFCDRDGGRISPSTLTSWWSRVRAANRLGKMRLHDFRHGYASVAVNRNQSLRTIGKLLGHRDPQTTLAYAHLSSPTKRDASEKIGEHMRQHLGHVTGGHHA
ncbi:site-specific integrase [bacterium]|nr:site-specific integrase [bacterium]